MFLKIPKNTRLFRLLNRKANENEDEDKSHNFKIQNNKRTIFTFKHIGKVIQSLFGEFYPHRFVNETKFTLIKAAQTKTILEATVSHLNSK
jgi:hypothetical protein